MVSDVVISKGNWLLVPWEYEDYSYDNNEQWIKVDLK